MRLFILGDDYFVGTPDDTNKSSLNSFAKELNVTVLEHKLKKPWGFKKLKSHFKGFEAEEICVVGDRLLTDVLFANLHAKN